MVDTAVPPRTADDEHEAGSAAPKGLIGSRAKRVEDPPLLTGRGRYLDDIVMANLIEGAVLRSPLAHARIVSIDTSAAKALPGVFDVITGADLEGLVKPQPVIYQLLADQRETPVFALATDTVRWAGQAVAAVAAVNRYVAEDALGLIDVEYEPLPVLSTVEQALASDATILYDGWDSNIVGTAAYGKGDVDAAFADADVVVETQLRLGRLSGCPLETRGVIATWDEYSGNLDVWLSTQSPHLARDLFGETFDIPIHRVRVRVPDVGGGFGNKFDFYVEEVIAAVLAKRTGRPVKIIEDRMEAFVATGQSRETVLDVAMAATNDGKIVGLKGSVTAVLGGAMGTVGVGPSWLTTTMMTGTYDIPNVAVDLKAVLTNRAPMGSYRGWGQPEANFAYERLVELVARKLGMDVNDVRRANFPAPEDFPFATGVVFAYDSGRYEECLDQCLAALRDGGWFERQAAARAEGRSVGIGYAFHVEATAFGPSRILNLVGLQHSGFDEEIVRIDPTGRVTVFTGQAAMGQGMHTALSQVAAEKLGVPLEHVTVVSGDTTTCPYTGYGTGASRAAAMGGGTLMVACEQLAEKVKRIAAHQLEADPLDIEMGEGKLWVRGSADRSVTLAQIGDAAYRRLNDKLPPDETPTLEGRHVFDPENLAWSYGCTATMVEVDTDTGFVTILDYLISHDCGTVINPMIVDGQIHGAVAQGIGEALFEELVYDSEGQLTTTTFLDYAIPGPKELPRIGLRHMETPAPHIPGGMKGMGESGTIGAPSAVVNAVDDALADLGVQVTFVPITPSRLFGLIQDAAATGNEAGR